MNLKTGLPKLEVRITFCTLRVQLVSSRGNNVGHIVSLDGFKLHCHNED